MKVTGEMIEHGCRAICSFERLDPDERVTYSGTRTYVKPPLLQWEMYKNEVRVALEAVLTAPPPPDRVQPERGEAVLAPLDVALCPACLQEYKKSAPPTDASGRVTDAQVQAGYFAEVKHEEDCGENWDRATWQIRIRKIIEAADRARKPDNAPAPVRAVECQHEPLHGFCVHCGIEFVRGRAVDEGATSEWPECSGDPGSCPENEGYGCCKPNPSADSARKPADQEAVRAVHHSQWGWVNATTGRFTQSLDSAYEWEANSDRVISVTPEPPISAQAASAGDAADLLHIADAIDPHSDPVSINDKFASPYEQAEYLRDIAARITAPSASAGEPVACSICGTWPAVACTECVKAYAAPTDGRSPNDVGYREVTLEDGAKLVSAYWKQNNGEADEHDMLAALRSINAVIRCPAGEKS